MKRSLTAVISACLMIQYAEAGRIHVTARVTDEEGRPISNALVNISFITNEGPGPDTQDRDHEGPTGGDGVYKAVDRADGAIIVSVGKDGYYTSNSGYVDTSKPDSEGHPKSIDPEVSITLRQKINPVPMYANDLQGVNFSHLEGMKVPNVDKDFAFDLIVGDWVAPYGKGAVPDVVFNAHGIYDDTGKNTGNTMRVSFPNNGDGVMQIPATQVWKQSWFKLPREAPIEGYTNEIFRWENWGEDRGYLNNRRKDLGYFLRIRTVKTTNDQVITALYGKIAGDFDLNTRHEGLPTITFKYYVNPESNSRNLEFDPRHNLFKNGGALEP